MTESIPAPCDYGRDNVMVLAAVRYCLESSLYSDFASDCADWLHRIWPALDGKTQTIIRNNIEAECCRYDAVRATGYGQALLWGAMQRREWERARTLWSAK